MAKETYNIPSIEIITIETESCIATSNPTIEVDPIPSNGGIDFM